MRLELEREDEDENEVATDRYMSAVLNYIKYHLGRNENEIKIALAKDGICSELTTRRKIKRLLELGRIEDRKEGNGFHRFYISDRNEYNRIAEILDDLYTLGQMLGNPNVSRFVATCYELLDLMLSIALYQINNGNLSKNDSAMFSRYVVNLALNLKLNYFSNDDEGYKNKMVQSMQSHLKNIQNLSEGHEEEEDEVYAPMEAVLDQSRRCVERLKTNLL
jgi:hypothetical protein